MKTRPALVAIALLIAAFTGSAQAQMAKNDFVKQAKGHLASAQAREYEEMEYCRLGTKVNLDLTVLWVSQRQRDLQAGDKIVQVNSTEVRTQEGFRAAMAAIAPGSPVNLTLERNGETKQVVGTCKSGREFGKQWNDLLRQIAKKDFKGCVSTALSAVVVFQLCKSLRPAPGRAAPA
ncbi:hypothetical protein GCM10011487_11350 [Steroidobacter agaridevorans]|uniref:PDZ domain-containing protein n=1 Tax=Steroidobacter agaridevorans TaxID=2695856 RepID=A0A829Y841_9GAMM|nr:MULTISPECIES: PDZ domain-containing protein [Steroidobacteraceae]GFE79135.1 hypothetical protein GCM10011487_11350 [Steroidobacter agaridevorans]